MGLADSLDRIIQIGMSDFAARSESHASSVIRSVNDGAAELHVVVVVPGCKVRVDFVDLKFGAPTVKLFEVIPEPRHSS